MATEDPLTRKALIDQPAAQEIQSEPNTDEKKSLTSALTKNLVFSLASAVIGSAFQFGYNTGVINAPGKRIQEFINETTWYRNNLSESDCINNSTTVNSGCLTDSTVGILWAFTVALFAVGGCIGGVSNGFFADRFGRKTSLLLNNVLGILGALLMGLSKPSRSYEMIMVGRFLIGLNCGLNSGLCPMYINELSPVRIRGAVGVLFQLGATFSIFLSQVLGLPELLGNKDYWALLLGLTGVFSVFQLITLPFCPESPRYLLIKQNRIADAESALKRLRGSQNIKQEVDDMTREADLEKSQEKFNVCQLFTARALLLPTIISIVMHLSQQLSGINAVFYYSTDILEKSGLGSSSVYATPFIGLIMVIMTFISLLFMEKAGRRFLHLLGLGGMFVFSILMTIAFVLQPKVDNIKYLSVVSMMLYIVFFAIGPGSIPWLIVAELFSQGPRSAAVSLAVLVNWSANVAVGQGFPPLFQNVTKEWTFLLFTFFLGFFWLFTYAFLPETKGRKTEEIVAYFQDSRNLFVFRKRNEKPSTVQIEQF